MSGVTQNELVDLIVQWVKTNKQSGDVPATEITEETDLLAAGLLDSFGFVDLVSFIEDQCDIRINLADVDPSEFSVVKGLCNVALLSSNGNHKHPIEIVLAPDLRQPSD